MSLFAAEFIGTMLLILLGSGVVANVVLTRSKGAGSGWIVITTGWALAVTLAVYCVGSASGGHLNPAVTLGLASIGKLAWAKVPTYLAAQLLGAMTGSVLVWLAYLPHWAATQDPATKLAVFCTAPACRHAVGNVMSEVIGTFVLVLGALAVASPANLVPGSGFDKGLGPALIGLIVWSIGLSLGGPTGYAINPVRDFGPRLAHALLPIAGKGGSDWGYAWVPILGPILGGIAGAQFYVYFWNP
ncbi:MAG: aquaporin family protein [Verrucomicrobia bacterium]|nr:aquaporin family protein [Verrucomicrobiota bacterium]